MDASLADYLISPMVLNNGMPLSLGVYKNGRWTSSFPSLIGYVLSAWEEVCGKSEIVVDLISVVGYS